MFSLFPPQVATCGTNSYKQIIKWKVKQFKINKWTNVHISFKLTISFSVNVVDTVVHKDFCNILDRNNTATAHFLNVTFYTEGLVTRALEDSTEQKLSFFVAKKSFRVIRVDFLCDFFMYNFSSNFLKKKSV